MSTTAVATNVAQLSQRLQWSMPWATGTRDALTRRRKLATRLDDKKVPKFACPISPPPIIHQNITAICPLNTKVCPCSVFLPLTVTHVCRNAATATRLRPSSGKRQEDPQRKGHATSWVEPEEQLWCTRRMSRKAIVRHRAPHVTSLGQAIGLTLTRAIPSLVWVPRRLCSSWPIASRSPRLLRCQRSQG